METATTKKERSDWPARVLYADVDLVEAFEPEFDGKVRMEPVPRTQSVSRRRVDIEA